MDIQKKKNFVENLSAISRINDQQAREISGCGFALVQKLSDQSRDRS
jgi:hypothetical protein